MQEEWRVHRDFPKLEFSNLGGARVRNPHAGPSMRETVRSDGAVAIVVGGETSNYRIPLARMVAVLFLQTTPRDLMFHDLIHVDGDSENCRADNLIWDRN